MCKCVILIYIIVVIIILVSIEASVTTNFHEKLNPQLYNLTGNYTLYNNNNEYITNIAEGFEIAKKSKIVICSLARNIKDTFEKSQKRLELTGNHFNEYKIVLFENDSSDNSRDLLTNWTNSNNNVILLECCNLGNCECKLKNKTGYNYGIFSEERFSKIALYR